MSVWQPNLILLLDDVVNQNSRELAFSEEGAASNLARHQDLYFSAVSPNDVIHAISVLFFLIM